MTEINSGSGYAIVAAEGERGDGDVDFQSDFLMDATGWAARITVSSNWRVDSYLVSGFATKEEAKAKVNSVIAAIVNDLGIANG